MAKRDKPLPKPPKSPFGQKRRFEHEEKTTSLLADQMARAAAEGRLEEFLQRELPDNKHARKLAELMMGMTGMVPMQGAQSNRTNKEKKASQKSGSSLMPLEDVFNAVQSGNINDVMGLLKREHSKRHPGSKAETSKKVKSFPDKGLSAEEKQVIDRLIQIASDNNVSLDWLILRALKVYVQEYEKTGKL